MILAIQGPGGIGSAGQVRSMGQPGVLGNLLQVGDVGHGLDRGRPRAIDMLLAHLDRWSTFCVRTCPAVTSTMIHRQEGSRSLLLADLFTCLD